MKNLTKLVGIALLSVFAFSCSDDDDNSNQLQTIAAIAAADANFSILVEALTRTGLASTFDSPGDFTVFAPTNDKFQAFLTANGFANVNAVPIPLLTEILKNHVVSGSFYSNELATGYVKTLAKGAASSTNTLSMYVEIGSTVKLNGGASNGGATVVTANIEASNGVIHVVDNVIGLPTVVNHAVANPNFTTLVGLVSGAGLVPTLSGTAGSPFTVFAPTNGAFTTFESQNPGVLASLTSAQVTSVLTYHVVGGANVLSTGIPSTPITTLESGTFTIVGTTITDEANRQTGIVAVDVQGSNGVIHVINNVLLPSL
ncbi:fasciclin domain-containing protein [Flavobacterium sp. J49]|uniref:fasciclin domain-containing protein n=1 Tax=Flavobacterium sp. J49 TaxID=2718534 RepID=UPI0015934E32|nr:fasciclin domain-containing protein [Flavobacterium sp. J49]MBF6640321.1 fasciclin domain-containing protein [Flavobacterium sp. J49]NIC01566.1 fasciclin domain-containing protein [Flavobacterium sp. J49]